MTLPAEEMFIQDRLNKGDVESLELLFHRYYNDLCRYVLIFVHDEDVAKNIVQDLYIYLWEHHQTINFRKSIEAYLYQACRFNTLIYIRNQNRHKEKEEKILNSMSVQQPTPDLAYEYKELDHILNEAISLLPDRCREIFILSRTRELTYAEIAEQLGISVSTVDNQINKAIKKIKSYLGIRYSNIIITLILFDQVKV